jgi:hypothetical protein
MKIDKRIELMSEMGTIQPDGVKGKENGESEVTRHRWFCVSQ